MAIFHGELKGRKPTGGRIRPHRKKRKYEMGREFSETKIGEKQKLVKIRTKGGGLKLRLKVANFANIVDPKTKKVKKVKILDVIENKANPFYTRADIITKGSIIKTEIGNAVVTSRPGQDGVVNAVLIENS